MHEMSLAIALVEQIEEEAKKNHLQKIDHVEIETGRLKAVIPEIMQDSFLTATKGTIAEGSTLTIIEVTPEAKCNRCEILFEPQIDNFLCPRCQLADVKIIKGDDIILKSITAEEFTNNKGEDI